MATTAATFTEKSWQTPDGLKLCYRDYPGPSDRPVLLCLPGLTRNARDFEGVAERLAGDWRVVCPSLRGRAGSAYARDPATYAPLTYVHDLETLFPAAGIERMVPIGTSLGGIMTMLMAATGNKRMAGAVLNDIGPFIEPKGLAAIGRVVGRSFNAPTWMHAAREIAEVNGDQFPGYTTEDWLRMAKRLCRLTPEGRVVLDYDPNLAEPFRKPGGAAPADLWPAFTALARIPVLCVRGALSGILSAETLAEMSRRMPSLRTVTVPNVGHAPTLEEPEAENAIDDLLAEVLMREARSAL